MLLLATPDQRRLFDALVPAIAAERGGAVVDHRWPDPVLRRAAESLGRARREGRVADDALILFSSGSTGTPRAIHRTCASWRSAHAGFADAIGLGADDVVSVPGPLASGIFLWGAWNAHEAGADVVLSGEDDERATMVFTVPSRLRGMLQRHAAGQLARVQAVVLGGEGVSEPDRQRCAEAGWEVHDYYGAAELSLVALRGPGDAALRPFGAVAVEARGRELWCRSPHLAHGYVEGDGPLRRDDDGWATVGDLGIVHPDGGVEVFGRGASAVSVAGHTVMVEDVERQLAALVGISEAVAVAVTHPRLGHVVGALYAGPATPSQLRTACHEMPAPARPHRWHRMSAVPRTPAGKIDRAACAALAREVWE